MSSNLKTMPTRDMRSPLAKARDYWLETLPKMDHYLKNRLEAAFLAGAEAATAIAKQERNTAKAAVRALAALKGE